ncbi:MAG TPA: AAA family ATPase [Solirubrobacteraceae bacterium]|nr:AAA family ATPase [Solirubrobacteraceae bacterium]
MIERERELAAVGELLDDARGAGRGGIVLVEGAAGLGKSRLLRESLGLAAGMGLRGLRGRGNEAETEFSFGVALQLFEPVLADESTDRATLFAGAAALAQPVFELRDPQQLSGRGLFSMLHGLHWLAANLAEREPLLLCVDDVHWCDEPTRRFLAYLAQRVEELPIVVLAATRPAEARGSADPARALRGLAAVRQLPLAPLTASGVSELVHARLSTTVDADFCLACAEATRGNPFFLGELLRALLDEGLEPSAAATERLGGLGVESISRWVLFRLGRMGDDAVGLAHAVAVLGDGSPLRHAAAVAGLGLQAATDTADRLATLDILERAELMSFSHPLVRASVYGDLSPAQRGMLHLCGARVLADEFAPPESIAAQLLLSAAGGEGWVVQALRDAARVAGARGAPESAARYLTRALGEPPAPGLRGEVLIELAAAEAASGSPDALQRCDEALEHVEEMSRRVRVRQLAGRVLAAQGDDATAARTFALALDQCVDPDDQGLREELLAEYVSAAAFDIDLRADALSRVDALDISQLGGASRGERALLAQLAVRAGQRAEPAAATVALAQRAWADGALLGDEGPDGQGWVLVYWALALAEDYLGAERVADAAVDQAQRLGLVLAHASALHWRSDCYLRQGRLAEALADAELALDAQRFGWRRYVAMAHAIRADALRERGQLDDAQRALALAIEVEDARLLLSAPRRRMASARLDMARHLYPRAYAGLIELGEVITGRFGVERTVIPWRAYAALAALQSSEPGRARELIAAELELGGRAQIPVSTGRALRISGLIEGGEGGIELLARAVTQLRATHAMLELARALVDLGGALRRAARRRESRESFDEGLELSMRCGAVILAERAREEIRATGARPRSQRRDGVDALTPSELRVAKMAADGLTNPEIAQALFVTSKTVEFHLRHVFQKLDISSRRQLRSVLRLEPRAP